MLVPVASLVEELLADDDLGELLRRGVLPPESEEAQEALEQPALVPGGGARLVVGLQPQDVLIDQGLSPDELQLGSIACEHTHTHTPSDTPNPNHLDPPPCPLPLIRDCVRRLTLTPELEPEAKVVAQSTLHAVPAPVEVTGVDQLGSIRIFGLSFNLLLNLMMMMMMIRKKERERERSE